MVRTAKIIVTFLAGLNFIVYVWRVSAEVSSRPNSNLSPGDELIHRFATVWTEQLSAIEQLGDARQDGKCLADPAQYFRPLFALTSEGESEFHVAWNYFHAWWALARTAYDYAVQPFIHLIGEHYREQNKSLKLLVTYDDPPPGYPLQMSDIQVVPFEKLIRHGVGMT